MNKLPSFIFLLYILLVGWLIGIDLYNYGVPTTYYAKCTNINGCEHPAYCDILEPCDIQNNIKYNISPRMEYNEEFGKPETFSQKHLWELLFPIFIVLLYLYYEPEIKRYKNDRLRKNNN